MPAIRPATRDDAPAVVALIGRVFVEYGWIWDPPTEVPDLLAFDAHYAAPRGAFWVVIDGEHLVGSVGVDRKPGDLAELHRLWAWLRDLHEAGRPRFAVPPTRDDAARVTLPA